LPQPVSGFPWDVSLVSPPGSLGDEEAARTGGFEDQERDHEPSVRTATST